MLLSLAYIFIDPTIKNKSICFIRNDFTIGQETLLFPLGIRIE